MARFCTVCGSEIPDGALFCTECGAKAPDPADVPAVSPEAAAPVFRPAYPASEPQPVQQAQPIQQAQPVQPAQPIQQAQPVRPVQSAPPTPPVQPIRPVQPVQSAPPVLPTQPARPTQPQQAREPQPVAYPPQVSAAPAWPEAAEKSQKPVSTIAFWALKLLYAIPVVGFFASLILAIAPANKSLKHHALAAFIWRIIVLALLVFGGIKLWNNFDPIWEEFTESVQEFAGERDIDNLDDLLNSLRNG